MMHSAGELVISGGKTGENGFIIAIIDACHSDSMDKDADDSNPSTYRGTDEIFGSHERPRGVMG